MNPSQPLVREEKESSITPVIKVRQYDRPSHSCAELIEGECALRLSGLVQEEICSDQLAVPQKFIQAAMQLIRPGLGDDIYYSTSRVCKLRTVVAGFDFVFLDEIDRWIKAWPVEGSVGIGATVQQNRFWFGREPLIETN